MKTNLSGRIRRLSLPPSKAMFPVYEAVANALHAIRDTGRTDGLITVDLQRRDEPRPENLIEARHQEPIHSVVIRDNGIGLDAKHMAAFEEVDTLYRAEHGGKGVGRLTWLKVFTTASVESVYRAADGFRRRSFTFALPTGVVARKVRDEPCNDGTRDTYTSVTLSGMNEAYCDQLTHRLGTIAAMIMRHFLPALLTHPRPKIIVRDASGDVDLEPTDVSSYQVDHVKVKQVDFTVHHMKIRGADARQHRIFRCADGREVESERLKFLPDHALLDEEKRTFFYHVYVFSPFFDERVSELRTSFNIANDADLFDEELSMPEITDSLRALSESFLAPQIQGLQETRDGLLGQILSNELEDLAYVREQNPTEIAAIPLTASREQIKQAVHAIHQKNQSSGRTMLQEIVSTLRTSTKVDLESFEKTFADKIKRITRPTQASLASYMLYRRSIIDIYRALLEKTASGYERESAIHNLIFPMGRDLDPSKMYGNHNLWLLDDRFSNASYIASNVPLRDHKALYGVTSDDVPDIACYFNLGFSEDDPTDELRTVVIVELKRPGPIKKNKLEENPWQQAVRYVETIREVGMWTRDDRQGVRVRASEKTRFYVFVVCDPTQLLIKRMINDFGFRAVFDGAEGWYRWDDHQNIYAEVWSLEKVLHDAERKHRRFFDRLGLIERT